MMPADLPPLPIEPPAIVRSMDAETAALQRAQRALSRLAVYHPALTNMRDSVAAQLLTHRAPELLCLDHAHMLILRLRGLDRARMFPDPPRPEMLVLARAFIDAARVAS